MRPADLSPAPVPGKVPPVRPPRRRRAGAPRPPSAGGGWAAWASAAAVLLAAVAAVAGCTPHGTSPSPPPALDARAADVSAPGHGAASAAPIAASGAGGKPGAAPADGPDQVAARAFFAQRCALCHGMDGRGDGPVAKTLRPKPRDYHDAEWQAGVTDDALSRAILHGGAAVGKSAMMPPSPDLADRPEVVAGLVTLIRSFRPN